ncbi:hypothetical protein AUEXF2481DRAFT_45295 [Aureobasidium subglaciale EXF-2481]|uniref:Cytochrome P450 n=1 Tax=Aureobasidium subglaciale (strain EXF-2481) TaxID=1043005 RepID=A0A074XXL9_AURSE|nr:uncharacterized protein AUEXF2481DRAFT_45295 [Aureobasidium subglaciale EXF-2481]KAI5194191.1 hypothetical protein E4T38_09665 [Aureobasidium subglaciale]KAI5213614.1 hypothetical protein E4T40_09607 [Aureobasidium subglaciale]KAI5215283.1 hypothetical protein E4T41_09645 [Aureobasidium subglaciale]KAI5253263.1 hypothetical protein E4T46_09622 [Aureobasidium subglaciale]KEQ90215.1 hypothetical protein AUEXF2481DRAFT_45295 [Aureobasidium subglaciale EXF-2481]
MDLITSTHLYIAGGIVLLYATLLRFTVGGKSSKDEPNQIPHWIPVIGHAFRFALNKREFFLWADRINAKKPFTVLLGGRKHYIFSDPADCAAIHKNGKSLHIRGFVRFIYLYIWGFLPEDADRMWEIKQEWHRIDLDWLLDPAKNRVITQTYLRHLEGQFKDLDNALEQSEKGVLRQAGLKTVVDLQGKATGATLWGETTMKLNPGLMDDLTVMVRDGFWPLLFNAPRWMFPKPYAARQRLHEAFADMITNIDDRPDMSVYVQERTRYLTSQGMSAQCQGADNLRTMFASLLNSMPTGYLALVHILTEPGLVDDVRAELENAGWADAVAASADSRDDALEPLIAIIPDKLPLMRSIWYETLRIHNNSLTVREVIAPTELSGKSGRTWRLEKGGVVSIPCGLMHYNEKLHPDPDGFHPGRFMEKTLGGEGESASRTLKPFGGGSTHCPGRVFAEKQMIGLVAGMIWRYDMTIVNKKQKIPKVGEFDNLAKQPAIWLDVRTRDLAA